MGSPFILPRAITPLTAPPGFPPDVAPNQIIYASHINAIRDSVAIWPGNVNGNSKTLANVAQIGIGTASPGAPLHIVATSLAEKFESSPGTNHIYASFANSGGETWIGIESAGSGSLMIGGLPYAFVVNTRAANALQLGTNNQARLTITPTGDVGIGVNPDTALVVKGLSNANVGIVKIVSSSVNNVGISLITGGAMVNWQISSNYSAAGNLDFLVSATSASDPTLSRFQLLSTGGIVAPLLPAANPGAGTKQLWYDPADGNRVKFAA